MHPAQRIDAELPGTPCFELIEGDEEPSEGIFVHGRIMALIEIASFIMLRQPQPLGFYFKSDDAHHLLNAIVFELY